MRRPLSRGRRAPFPSIRSKSRAFIQLLELRTSNTACGQAAEQRPCRRRPSAASESRGLPRRRRAQRRVRDTVNTMMRGVLEIRNSRSYRNACSFAGGASEPPAAARGAAAGAGHGEHDDAVGGGAGGAESAVSFGVVCMCVCVGGGGSRGGGRDGEVRADGSGCGADSASPGLQRDSAAPARCMDYSSITCNTVDLDYTCYSGLGSGRSEVAGSPARRLLLGRRAPCLPLCAARLSWLPQYIYLRGADK